jgi:alkanesulfonate monooxygenase SsuD/methylene tetrahydromethanopterin reductase-like flavin-dependent oxidoreductase (luciferase family)
LSAASPPSARLEIGLGLFATEVSDADRLKSLVFAAQDRGIRNVWFSERAAGDALVACASIASLLSAETCLGTAAISAFDRTPRRMAQSVQSLHQVTGTRFELGVGISSPQLQRAHGLPITTTVDHFEARLVEIRDQVTRELAGMSRLLVAALGPRMLSLGAQLADGIIVSMMPSQVARERLRDLPPTYRVALVPVALGSEERALRRTRMSYTQYCLAWRGHVNPYADIIREYCGSDAHAALSAAIRDGNPLRVAACVPRNFIAALGIFKQCTAAQILQGWSAAPVDQVVLFPTSTNALQLCIDAVEDWGGCP